MLIHTLAMCFRTAQSPPESEPGTPSKAPQPKEVPDTCEAQNRELLTLVCVIAHGDGEAAFSTPCGQPAVRPSCSRHSKPSQDGR